MTETIRFRFVSEGKDYSRVMRAHSLRTRAVWLSLAESKLSRDSFRQVIETRTDFLLCHATSKHMVQFVPKRALDSPEQEEAFRAPVRSKLPVGRWV